MAVQCRSVIRHLVALSLLSSQVDVPSIEKTLASELEETRTPGVALVIVRGELLQMFLWVFKKDEVAP